MNSKLYFLLILIFTNLSGIGQEIEIWGEYLTPSSPPKEIIKIYYAFNNNSYTENQYVTCDSLLEFRINFQKSSDPIDTITSLHFSDNLKNSRECSHVIHIDNILKSELTASKKPVIIKVDFDSFTYCDFTMFESATDDGNDIYIGKYDFQRDDEKLVLELRDSYFLKIKYPELKSDFTNSEFGSWNYRAHDNKLIINIRAATNPNFGVYRKIGHSYEFDVKKIKGVLKFLCSEKLITLSKME